jgi:hypothetical protein
MVDWRTAYTDQSPMLVAPFVVSAVAAIALVYRARDLGRRGGVAFACALAGIFFGTVYGLVRYSPFDVGRGVVNWAVPVVFGFFLYAGRERYEELRDAFLRSFVGGAVVASVYAVVQFFVMPAWDETWMLGLKDSVFGQPFPREVRVFSTMNAPVVMALFAMAALLMVLAMVVIEPGRKRRWVETVVGVVLLVALGLTTSRAFWLALLFGVGYLAWSVTGRARMRLAGAAVVFAVLAGAATAVPGIHETLVARLKSFQSGTSDVSASARIEGHQQALVRLATEPMGEGMGSTDVDHATDGSDDSIGPHDSTVLELLYSLGGPGTLVYGIGMIWGLGTIFVVRERRGALEMDAFGVGVRAILFAVFAQMLLNSILVAAPGLLIWSCMGFALAAAESREG